MQGRVMGTMDVAVVGVQDDNSLCEHEPIGQCRHCHTTLASQGASGFCCAGCRMAYQLIAGMDLTGFYERLRGRHLKPLEGRMPADFAIYDEPSFQEKFCSLAHDSKKRCHFYLDNLECYACVWVLEKALMRQAPKSRVSINLAEGTGLVEFDPLEIKLSQIAQLFYDLGHQPTPVGSEPVSRQGSIVKLGIAFFCLMNVMLLSTGEYLADDLAGTGFQKVFQWVSAVMTAGCFIFAADGFFKNSFKAMMKGRLHLDIPISLALALGFGYSLLHTWQAAGAVYYDSLNAIVALLLVGRTLQKQSLSRHLQKINPLQAVSPFYRIVADKELVLKELQHIAEGERLLLRPGDMVPVAGILDSDTAYVSMEFMTGEPHQRKRHRGARLAAGAVIHKNPIYVKATEPGLSSRLRQLQEDCDQLMLQKGLYSGLSEKLSQFFVILVLAVVALIFFSFWQEDPEMAIDRAMATLIIACPCAFGLGVPLWMTRALHLGRRNGVLIRSQRGFEQLGSLKTFCFDKTGTLTRPSGVARLGQVYQSDALQQLWPYLSLLSQLSQHHGALALGAYAQSQGSSVDSSKALFQMEEVPGAGLMFRCPLGEVKVGRKSFVCDQGHLPSHEAGDAGGELWVSLRGALVAGFQLSESLDPAAATCVKTLLEHGITCHIASGDQQARVARLCEQLPGLSEAQGEMSPESKANWIHQRKDQVVMIGDGLNDAPAMSRAALSIAVANATALAKQRADLVLLTDGLQSLLPLWQMSQAARAALMRAFAFALCFNILGISLSIQGLMSPVMAAVLMPISSLTMVLLSSRWGRSFEGSK